MRETEKQVQFGRKGPEYGGPIYPPLREAGALSALENSRTEKTRDFPGSDQTRAAGIALTLGPHCVR